MGWKLSWTPVLAAIALAVGAAGAIAGAAHNSTYSGRTAHGRRPLTLKVSADGRSVTMNVPFPPLFCQGGGALERQITRPATISHQRFRGSITYEYKINHRRNIRLYFSGKFYARSVSGTVRAEYLRAPQCNGTTSYSAQR